jgi:uncharacterized membrane protein YozB (DUF420 family)
MIEPTPDFLGLILLALVALMTGFSTALSNGRSLAFVAAAVAGSFVGLCSGWAIFPSSDGIANSYAPLVIVAATLAVSLASLAAAVIGRGLRVSAGNHQRAVWLALICCVAFGPLYLAILRPLVAL